MTLVGVDWGTTSLRVARLDDNGGAIEERELPRGILTVPAGGFPRVFDEACGDWMKPTGSLALVCGMAGSRQGWKEAPYAPCPATFSDVAAKLSWIEPGRIAVVPGLSIDAQGTPDVMRGEETKAFGAIALTGMQDGSIVMPGTHCKWVRVRAGRIASFATYMTGEFYALLRQHSILARTMGTDDSSLDTSRFMQGLECAMEAGNLLHAAFSARTLALFERLPEGAAPSYLSGLLVGEELRSQQLDRDDRIVLVGARKFTERYGLALSHLGVEFRTLGQEATWLGLHAIAKTLKEVA